MTSKSPRHFQVSEAEWTGDPRRWRDGVDRSRGPQKARVKLVKLARPAESGTGPEE
jgi:hypothetical protein